MLAASRRKFTRNFLPDSDAPTRVNCAAIGWLRAVF
jgi:hypothetical protein